MRHQRGLKWWRAAALLIAGLVVARLGVSLLPEWRRVGGWETYWIAQALVAGEGYSMPAGHSWLFDEVDNDPYVRFTGGEANPTAWADPVYTLLLAGMIRVFGEYHQLAASILNLLLMLAVLLLTYRLGERLGAPLAGILAVLVLALVRGFSQRPFIVMNNMLLGATLVVAAALCLLRYLDAPSRGRAAVLGGMLGVTALGMPGGQLFIPISACAAVALGWRHRRQAFLRAGLIVAGAALVMLPWSLRNYLVFGEFVPVRTGVGQIAFVSVVGIGGTFAPDRLRSRVKPAVTADTPFQAIHQVLRPPYRELAALERFQLDYARELGGAEYEAMNEAQRDAWFLAETRRFIRENPGMTIRLAQEKLEVFMRMMGRLGTVVCFLAVLGALLNLRRPAVPVLTLWIASYVGPFLIILAYYPRYRAPIEPLLGVLAGLAVWRVGRMGVSLMHRRPAAGAATGGAA